MVDKEKGSEIGFGEKRKVSDAGIEPATYRV